MCDNGAFGSIHFGMNSKTVLNEQERDTLVTIQEG
ncbi:hypothetical protein [Pseudomonas phage PA1C]|nr:hypothetical protein [Pseudomonas phage PA1C]